jgi:hypothetical protein
LYHNSQYLATILSPRIDKLRDVVSRGIIPDGFAATTHTMDGQIPTWVRQIGLRTGTLLAAFNASAATAIGV